ncbi:hypothetical protein EN935_32690 [Mesorhizobium sp. M7D.F.Ca.US.004.03.1.1]|nr:hypothetical protein EN993_11875 [Mesorhizobium sp. M7D.F.Ca.US.004.01.2.1]RVA21001.1 hypothetical protein EN935_32690 [Mesorhizobium sp. M7D.F.Ca.US.004.03.1.1]
MPLLPLLPPSPVPPDLPPDSPAPPALPPVSPAPPALPPVSPAPPALPGSAARPALPGSAARPALPASTDTILVEDSAKLVVETEATDAAREIAVRTRMIMIDLHNRVIISP